jgi:hypothetical protein
MRKFTDGVLLWLIATGAMAAAVFFIFAMCKSSGFWAFGAGLSACLGIVMWGVMVYHTGEGS